MKWLKLLALAFIGGCGWRDVEADPNAVRIMPLGDSITQGDFLRNSYRRPLWHRLKGEGFRVNFVGSQRRNHIAGPPDGDFDRDHEGHWGWTINQVLERLDGWARAANPDVALIHLGTNDLFQGDDPDTIARELAEVVTVLRAANPRVAIFLAELIPARGSEAAYVPVNARIRALSSMGTSESPVTIVDMFSGFDVDAHTYDGVHPNAAGESLLAERWFSALAPFLRAGREGA
jgi:lysophospholipase L1-like esterase